MLNQCSRNCFFLQFFMNDSFQPSKKYPWIKFKKDFVINRIDDNLVSKYTEYAKRFKESSQNFHINFLLSIWKNNQRETYMKVKILFSNTRVKVYSLIWVILLSLNKQLLMTKSSRTKFATVIVNVCLFCAKFAFFWNIFLLSLLEYLSQPWLLIVA